jgi:hypothetical protein
LELQGHFVEVHFLTQADSLNHLLLVVLCEEIQCRKAQGKVNHGLGSRTNAAAFLQAWKETNSEVINEKLGTVEENFRFVDRILFSLSTSKRTAPHLQTVFQAGAAHLNWGKYTLYSLYGTTAECQCTAVSFGILFRNEDLESWISFGHLLLMFIHG